MHRVIGSSEEVINGRSRAPCALIWRREVTYRSYLKGACRCTVHSDMCEQQLSCSAGGLARGLERGSEDVYTASRRVAVGRWV